MSRIMLVQPHTAGRDEREQALKGAGHHVFAVATIHEAERVGQSFDVGVFAIDLPDGSGLHLAARMSGLGRVHSRLFVATDPNSALARRAAAMGPLLRADAPLSALLDAIDQVLSAQAQEDGAARSRVRPSTLIHTWPQARVGGGRED